MFVICSNFSCITSPLFMFGVALYNVTSHHTMSTSSPHTMSTSSHHTMSTSSPHTMSTSSPHICLHQVLI